MSGGTSRRRAGHGRINSTNAVLLHGCENEVALAVAFVKFPGGARPAIAPHPTPCHQQHGGVDNEIEQIVEPASRILAGPSVQLRLDPQYPDRYLGWRWPWCA